MSKPAKVDPPGKLPPRVRIAPSPTGDPHVGTAYIGLFNYAFARHYGGKFILRVEDTDQARSTKSSEEAILAGLRWVGLDWDEGPDVGGPHGPYRQSERTELYREAAEELLEKGAAYRCFCTAERLTVMRAEQKARGKHGYDGLCRRLDPDDAKRRAGAGEPFVVRLAVPETGEVVAPNDISDKGGASFQWEEIDDQILLKSDGFPTYHLANVVDDHHMGITHVIRGEEWTKSTPKHLRLYEAFGWEPPRFWHLGLLRNPDGSKLSKRKNPTSIFHYRDMGYLPETFLNFLGNMGYSFPDDKERFTLQELVDEFDWTRLKPGGPKFDTVKLDAFNADDIHGLEPDALRALLMERVFSPERMRPIVELSRERIKRLDDFVPFASFFFGDELDYTAMLPKVRVKGRSRKEVTGILLTFLEEIETNPSARGFDAEGLDTFLKDFITRHGWKPREFYPLLRIAVTARKASPPLGPTMVACGKDRVRARIRDLVKIIKQGENF
jgi:glutamyl-tRNA synthetase